MPSFTTGYPGLLQAGFKPASPLKRRFKKKLNTEISLYLIISLNLNARDSESQSLEDSREERNNEADRELS